MAADLPIREAPPPPMIAPVPIFTWTGFYVGANAGWGWLDDNNTTGVFVPAGTFAPPFAGVSGTLGGGGGGGDDNGFIGGGQVGFNYQMGAFVIGAEADIQWADFNVENNVFVVPATFPPSFVPAAFADDDMEWFGTVRARAGVAFGQALIYATGGFAYSDNNTGWVAGGGLEWAIPTGLFGSSAATIGLEGLWVSLERDDDNNGGFIGTYVPTGTATRVDVFVPNTDGDDNEFFVARAKLNFKFGTF
jgi:outer membrane immunogenic protein